MANSIDAIRAEVRAEGYRGRDVIREVARRHDEAVTDREAAGREADERAGRNQPAR